MKVKLNTKTPIFPMPVLMIATYNEDGTIDMMNAAWGMVVDYGVVALNLAKEHETVENILKRKAFTVSLGTKELVTECDYLGIVSQNDVKDKFERTKLTTTKSSFVDAPIVNEFPITFECEFIEFQENEYGCGVIGKVVNVLAEENVLMDGKLDIDKVGFITYDPFTHGYYEIKGRVADAFKEGKKIK